MTVVSLVSKLKKSRIIAIDPASHSLAWAILDMHGQNLELVDYGKIDFSSLPEMSNKFEKIKQDLPEICFKYKPNIGVIEQSVYIQNFQASRILSYIIGFSWGELIEHCSYVQDVNPLQWKSGIGYKNINKLEVARIEKEFGKKGIQKRLVDERKNRVKRILELNIPNVNFADMDSDISDAIGIGLWYSISHGIRTLQR